MCVCGGRLAGRSRGGGKKKKTTLNSHSWNVSIGEERNRKTARLENKQTNKQKERCNL